MGAYIVSMTHSSADLLTVYLLMREAGLLEWQGQQFFCPVSIVPLFETIEDLRKSSHILDEFLSLPITRMSLERQAKSGV